MRSSGFAYEVHAEVHMTLDEIDLLREVAARHYDSLCQASAAEGGFIYGWKNAHTPSCEGEPRSAPIRVKFSQLDTCIKILEMAVHVYMGRGQKDQPDKFTMAMNLSQQMRDICAEINQEYRRLSPN